MSWAGALTALDTHLATAAAVVNALDTNAEPVAVQRGEPQSIMQRVVAYTYEGDIESTPGHTLGLAFVMEKLTIRWYFPVLNTDRYWMGDLEVLLQAANRATQDALYGDEELGGNSIKLHIDDTSAGWTLVGEARVRVLTIPVRIDMPSTEDIVL